VEEEWLTAAEAAILLDVDQEELELWMNAFVIERNAPGWFATDEQYRQQESGRVFRRQDSSTGWEVKYRRRDFEDAIALHFSKRLTGA